MTFAREQLGAMGDAQLSQLCGEVLGESYRHDRIGNAVQDEGWWKACCGHPSEGRNQTAGDVDDRPDAVGLCRIPGGGKRGGQRQTKKGAQRNARDDDAGRIHVWAAGDKPERVIDRLEPLWDVNAVAEQAYVGAFGAGPVEVMRSVQVDACFLQDGGQLIPPKLNVASGAVQKQDRRAFAGVLVMTCIHKLLGADPDAAFMGVEAQSLRHTSLDAWA